jgi:rare lipoprotein A (peptidoglycan hydrolase)
LSGCVSATREAPILSRRRASNRPASVAGPAAVAADQRRADAVPRFEPRSRYGNPPFYEVFGKRYYVLASSSIDYVERGVASWYGPGFHKVRTSIGRACTTCMG